MNDRLKPKGVYLIADPSVLKADLGPSEHIKAGLEELGKVFRLEVVVLGKSRAPKPSSQPPAPSWRPGSKLWGLFRDLKRLVAQHVMFFYHLRQISRLKPDFIYERSAYLNFNGLWISRWLRIPHFYEVNWVHYLGMQQFYPTYFTPWARRFEERAYDRSTHNFFVGNQDQYLTLKKSNWSRIQNGVRSRMVHENIHHLNPISTPVQVCMLANLMPHHRIDLLLAAFPLMKHVDRLQFHFIGHHFETALERFPKQVSFVRHGPVPHEALGPHLERMQAGLILGGPEYSSFMKLYEYAAFKLAVVCPDVSNLTSLFGADEILFFTKEDPRDLARALDRLAEGSLQGMGERLYQRVSKEFTWERIFEGISGKIQAHLEVVS